MAEIGRKYNEILKDLEENIKDPKELEYVKNKFSDLSMLFIDMLDRVTKLTNTKMQEIENKQQEISNRINSVQSMVDEIESDIYEEDEFTDGYEFEIVCPYCNYKFEVDLEGNEDKEEVQCPECKNIIELDWNCEEDDGCSCNCSSCRGNCVAEDEEDYKIEDNKENEEDM